MMSNSTSRPGTPRRRYELGRRAQKQMETRRRIVEAAVDLHGTLGPARTSVMQIAERAGVQRHTFYAHFPNERDLLLACSGLTLERDPLPDLSDVRKLPAGAERVRKGLEQFYGWFERNAQLVSAVMRDAQYHEVTRETVELRIGPALADAAQLLGERLDERSRVLLDLALDFGCWRQLSRTQDVKQAAELMSAAVTRV